MEKMCRTSFPSTIAMCAQLVKAMSFIFPSSGERSSRDHMIAIIWSAGGTVGEHGGPSEQVTCGRQCEGTIRRCMRESGETLQFSKRLM